MRDAASHKWDACTQSWRYARLCAITEGRLHPLTMFSVTFLASSIIVLSR
jgi:hypothetical protein